MLVVNYQITLGSTTYTANDRSRLVYLQTTAALAIPSHRCRLVLAQPQTLKVAPQDEITVKLGYGDSLKLVFTGIVETVEWDIDRVTVQATSGFRTLVSARFNLLYEQPNAGDIAKDIVQNRLKLKGDQIENGLKFPVYVLGDRISAYEHLRTLARQCGFDFYANTQDKAVFAEYKAANTHRLSYGSSILSVNAHHPSTGITGVEIYGESPSSQGQGEQAYTWLTKKEVKGTAGSGSGLLLRLEDATARTEAIAGTIAQSTLANRRQKQRGQVTVLGDSNLALGDAIAIANMPLDQQNGTFKIVGVNHRLNCQQGFYTLIDWEDA